MPVRVHAQANENDGSVFATPVTTPISGKNIFIEKYPQFPSTTFPPIGPMRRAMEVSALCCNSTITAGSPSTLLVLNAAAAPLLIFVNGRIITELLVDRRVSDGQIFIASGLTAADIASMQKTWRQHRREKTQMTRRVLAIALAVSVFSSSLLAQNSKIEISLPTDNDALFAGRGPDFINILSAIFTAKNRRPGKAAVTDLSAIRCRPRRV